MCGGGFLSLVSVALFGGLADEGQTVVEGAVIMVFDSVVDGLLDAVVGDEFSLVKEHLLAEKSPIGVDAVDEGFD